MSVPLNLLSNLSLLRKLDKIPPGTFSTVDAIEGYFPYHEDWNYDHMNDFAAGSGEQLMTQFLSLFSFIYPQGNIEIENVKNKFNLHVFQITANIL